VRLGRFIFPSLMGLLIGASAENSLAEDPLVCKDLNRMSCRNTSENDGTGTAVYASNEKLTAFLKAKKHAQILQHFSELLHNPQKEGFKRLVMKAYGNDKSPGCGPKDSNMDDSCLFGLSQRMTVEAETEIFGSALSKEQEEFKLKQIGLDGDIESFEHYLNMPDFKELVDQSKSDIVIGLRDTALRNKIQVDIFPKVKAILIAKIKQDVGDEAVRIVLINEIDSLHWSEGSCTTPTISDVLTPRAFIAKNGFQVCDGLLAAASSEFSLVQVVAHELAHQIDPCFVGAIFIPPQPSSQKEVEEKFPFERLVGCLRGQKSTGATRFVEFPKLRGDFCNTEDNAHDQITEAFADWMASEITPVYMEKYHSELTPEQFRKGYSNAFKILCYTPVQQAMIDNLKKHGIFDQHPDVDKRINGTIMVQPQVRAQMGCKEEPANYEYCSVPSNGTEEIYQRKLIERLKSGR
jgi:hypothetical protein